MPKDAKNAGIQWALGVLSGLSVTAIVGLAQTVVKHEIKLALLEEDCGKKKRSSAVYTPAQKNPSFWSAFGLVGAPSAKPMKGSP